MRAMPDPVLVKEIVQRVFRELGARLRKTLEMSETLRIDRGQFFARSYRAAGLLATWLLDLGLVHFYDSRGNRIRTINLGQELPGRRMAA